MEKIEKTLEKIIQQHDIFDLESNFVEGNIFVVRYPKMDFDTYLSQILKPVIKKKVSFLFLIENIQIDKILPYIENIPYLKISEEKLIEIIEKKYYALPKKIIGITGSVGKTSTCFFLWQILTQLGFSTFLSCTLGKGVKTLENTSFTTETLLSLKRFLHINSYCDFAVIEVSSQGFAQKRVHNIPFNITFLTYILHLHSFFHGDFDSYKKTKIDFLNSGQYKFTLEKDLSNNEIKLLDKEKFYYDDNFFYLDKEKVVNNLAKNSTIIQKENVLHALTLAEFTLSLIDLHHKISEVNLSNLNMPFGRSQFFGQTKKGANIFVDGAFVRETMKLFVEKFPPEKTTVICGITTRALSDGQDFSFLKKFLKIFVVDDNPRLSNPEELRQIITKQIPHAQDFSVRFTAIAKAIHESEEGENILIIGKSSEAQNKIAYKDFEIQYSEIGLIKDLVEVSKLNSVKKSEENQIHFEELMSNNDYNFWCKNFNMKKLEKKPTSI